MVGKELGQVFDLRWASLPSGPVKKPSATVRWDGGGISHRRAFLGGYFASPKNSVGIGAMLPLRRFADNRVFPYGIALRLQPTALNRQRKNPKEEGFEEGPSEMGRFMLSCSEAAG